MEIIKNFYEIALLRLNSCFTKKFPMAIVKKVKKLRINFAKIPIINSF